MAWYPAVGYSVFWIALVVAIILYVMKRKWYPIAYLISISLYGFAVAFVIDVFDLTRAWTLLTLAISSVLMIFLGWHLSKRFKDKK